MKKYIITEEQLTKLLLEEDKPITKGIALHITDDQGDYYESKLMEFNGEEEYNVWKDSLDENTKIIGEMDIEEKNAQPMNESINEKQKGFDILSKMIKKHYPYLSNVRPTDNSGGTYLSVDMDIDLNKFYKITGTTPPKKLEEYLKEHMFDLLRERGMYLRRYVDNLYKDEYENNFNDKLNELLNKYYNLIPQSMQYTKFEGRTDDELMDLGSGSDFYIRWRDEKEPINLEINYFYPQVDVDKL